MTTYYRGPEVVITHQVFAVLQPAPQVFEIDELYGIHVAPGRPRWFGARSHQLRAVYNGFEVLLFESADIRTFGQVRRGLVRALEGMRERHEEYGSLGYH